MPRDFVFIKTDNRGKTKKSDRKLIRSRCMNGKNLRIGIRPTRDEKSDAARGLTGGKSGPSAIQRRILDHSQLIGNNREAVRPVDLYEKLSRLPIPGSPNSDLSVLADSTDEGARLHFVHFLSHAAHIIYPVELCVDFDLRQSNGIRWMFEDRTYFHFTLFFTSAINDAYLRRPLAKTTYYHLGRTIASLNEKLARSELDDSTISVISSLVIVSAYFTDYTAAKAHFAGLQQIVQLRGGLEAFHHNLELYIKLARVDLTYTLHTGQTPLFVHDGLLPQAWANNTESPIHRDNESETSHRSNSSLTDSLHHRLPVGLEAFVNDIRITSIFSDLQHISSKLNHRRRLQDSEFKLAIASIQYRLLSLSNSLDEPVAECLRLAMLVFLTTTFEIPENAGQRYPYLSGRFQESCCAVLAESQGSEVWNDVSLWLLIVGGVSLYGLDQAWLREWWAKVVSVHETWQAARSRLRRILWIDALHDKLGKQMFDALNGNHVDEMAAKKSKSSAWWLSGWGICPLEL